MNKNIAINKYITLEYFANTYNSQHRGSYSDETIQYYIDNASIRVDNLINNPIWDFDSSEIWRQDLVKYAVAVMTEHWLKQGNNLSLQQISGTVGSISFSSDQSNLEYVPKLVLDLLIRAEARVSESFDADTEGTGDPNTYSPVFKTQQRLADVSIEEAPNDSLILLTKDETIKLLADASAGEFQFSTGEFLSSIGLEKVNSDDVIVYTKGVVDNMFVIRDNQITNLSQTKANVADVYTKGVIDTQQRDQDNLIKANTQKGNSNAAQINALKKILEAGGLTKEIFNSTANVTLTNTAYRLNPNIKIESNRPEMLTYVQETNYKKFIIKQNGLFEIDIVSTLKRIGTNIFTVSLELYDAATNTLLDTQNQEFNLTNTTTVNNQVGKISYKVSDISPTKLQREFYVSAKLLEIGATVTSATGSLIAASLLTDLGSGKVATTDDALNTSNVTGTTNTDALNKLYTDLLGTSAIAVGNTGAIELLNTNKQDKTDNALTTTDKTIVGAINEINTKVGDEEWEELSFYSANNISFTLQSLQDKYSALKFVYDNKTGDTNYVPNSYEDVTVPIEIEITDLIANQQNKYPVTHSVVTDSPFASIGSAYFYPNISDTRTWYENGVEITQTGWFLDIYYDIIDYSIPFASYANVKNYKVLGKLKTA